MTIWSSRFTGQAVPATGVSASGLIACWRHCASQGPDRKWRARGPVVVTVMDRDRMADYQAMVGELRRAGIRAEVYLGNPKNFGNQLKYADKRQSPVAVIAGSDEFEADKVQIKDLILGAEIAENATLEEWEGTARASSRHRVPNWPGNGARNIRQRQAG